MGYKAWVMMSQLNQEKTESLLQMFPLITCKDCKYARHDYATGAFFCTKLTEKYTTQDDKLVNKDWFCADGEWRETE